MLLLISLVNKQNKQIRQSPIGVERFSRDQNYTMTTIFYLKIGILLTSSPMMPRQLVHCKLIELDIITLQCLMLNPLFWWAYGAPVKNKSKLQSNFWFKKAINPSRKQRILVFWVAKIEINIYVEPYHPLPQSYDYSKCPAASEENACNYIDELASIVYRYSIRLSRIKWESASKAICEAVSEVVQNLIVQNYCANDVTYPTAFLN